MLRETKVNIMHGSLSHQVVAELGEYWICRQYAALSSTDSDRGDGIAWASIYVLGCCTASSQCSGPLIFQCIARRVMNDQKGAEEDYKIKLNHSPCFVNPSTTESVLVLDRSSSNQELSISRISRGVGYAVS